MYPYDPYDCDETSTWADVGDLRERFGDEYIDKLATRRNFDSARGEYLSDETSTNRLRVITLALCDARELILRKLSCLYKNLYVLDKHFFHGIKQWHIKLAIETLKAGGDCSSCGCIADLDKYLECGRICADDGTCLESLKTFISVTSQKFPCEDEGCGC